MAISKEQLEQRSNAARKHGIYSFQDRGESTLEPTQVNRLQELRKMVKTHPGRMELREELAARCALICDLAMSELSKTQRSGQSIWTSPVIKRTGTFFAELRRVLDSFPDESELGASADIISQGMNENGKNT